MTSPQFGQEFIVEDDAISSGGSIPGSIAQRNAKGKRQPCGNLRSRPLWPKSRILNENPTEFSFEVAAATGERLDVFLAARMDGYSRSRLQSLIRDGHVLLNDRSPKAKAALAAGDTVRVHIPETVPSEAQAQDIPLTVLYEDDDLLVLDKPHGMVVHPAAGNPDGTLVNALLHHCGALSTIGGVNRPGIVHRLDKDTSGCIVVARNDATHQALSAQFSDRETSKIYLAVVERRPAQDQGRLETHIGRHPRDRQRMAVVVPPAGKLAITEYRVLVPRADASLVECRIFTGRTHQIRVHLREIGHPILGDPIYAHPSRQPVPVPRLMLHARQLGFRHPTTGREMVFQADIPPEFESWARSLD
jgi:23S rRNA pseudouridine1911/1915/1917 synthase